MLLSLLVSHQIELPAVTMRYLSVLVPTLLATSTVLDLALAARKPSDSVLLSSVKTLTLKKDAKTSHRRVSAIPQVLWTSYPPL